MSSEVTRPPRPPRPWWQLPGLFVRTLQNLRPHQVTGRLGRRWRMAKAALLGVPRPRLKAQPAPLPRPFALGAVRVSPMAEAVMAGRWAFLNLPPALGPTPPWRQASERGLLWQFQLHEFGWALDLVRAASATGDRRPAEQLVALMLDWVRHNPPGRGPGWHPYPTARRLVVWCQVLAALQDTLALRAAWEPLSRSLATQAMHLLNTLEYDLLGNHWLANLHALTWADACLAPWLAPTDAARLHGVAGRYWEELLAQTRPDGSHEENSPAYTRTIFQDAFETLVMVERAGWGVPEGVRPRLLAMGDHLMGLMQPDGRLPLLNDSPGAAPEAARALLAAAAVYFDRPDWRFVAGEAERDTLAWLFGEPGLAAYDAMASEVPSTTALAFAQAGCYVLREGWQPDDDYMLFDCGPLGPRHQMGHGHADSLAVLLWSHGQPILIDPGVYSYRAGPWRDHFRGTPAHNTVTVDGQDSSEVWAAFRTARAAEAHCDDWRPGERVVGSHTGYARLRDPVRHQRTVTCLGRGHWRITDCLEAGGGAHDYAWTFQLAPQARLAVQGLAARVELGPACVAEVEVVGPQGLVLTPESNPVSPDWHVKTLAPALKLRLAAADRQVVVTTTWRIGGRST
ncbi:MAG: alginate lyase family protein [Candidatus Sericytochromatia bacterium]|nr:alginate lyase family protein [Candidatus Sericytochromatia bacterium]